MRERMREIESCWGRSTSAGTAARAVDRTCRCADRISYPHPGIPQDTVVVGRPFHVAPSWRRTCPHGRRESPARISRSSPCCAQPGGPLREPRVRPVREAGMGTPTGYISRSTRMACTGLPIREPDPTSRTTCSGTLHAGATMRHGLDGASQSPGTGVCETFDTSASGPGSRSLRRDRATVVWPGVLARCGELAESAEHTLELPWHFHGTGRAERGGGCRASGG